MGKIITFILFAILSSALFAQGSGSDGGPNTILNAARGVNGPDGAFDIMGPGAIAGVDWSQVYVSGNGIPGHQVTNEGNPYDIIIAHSDKIEAILGGDGTGGVYGVDSGNNPFMSGAFATDADLSEVTGNNIIRFVDPTAAAQMRAAKPVIGHDIIERAQAMAERRGLVGTSARSQMAFDFERLGDVVDMETTEYGVVDRETLRDLKPSWLQERDGEIWVRKDAPVVNYQTDNGEVIDFGFTLERDDD